jgi:diaminohydroxyphosphoribosylaminopyrimidine deaminase / 5-amino-6-(5-phosphoribosylamino)uracil reductase
MHRCLQLARLARGRVAPNPMVGAVLVHNDRIIGEGYHQQYGEAHAEVNCINSVKAEDGHLISQSTLYVSLEPCAHFGKTPPCADLIIEHKIPKVIIGCRDPFVQVNGKGIEKLHAAGIETEVGVLENECKELNKRFFFFNTQHRPYIVLKWAMSADGKIAPDDRSRTAISNEKTNRLVHKWRSEEMAILVGTNTAAFDDPELTTRLWPGGNPIRLVVDLHLRLPSSLKLFDRKVRTVVFNLHKHEEKENLLFYQMAEDASVVHQIMNALYQMKLQSVLIEGGAQLLQSFVDEGMWDEARVICNEELIIGSGIPAPQLQDQLLINKEVLSTDTIRYYKNNSIIQL